jgi:hypothetical protein
MRINDFAARAAKGRSTSASWLAAAIIGATTAATSGVALAAPIPQGDNIGMSGAFQAEDGGGINVPFISATTIDFIPNLFTTTFATSGVFATDFAPFTPGLTTGTIQDLLFDGFVPINDFWTITNAITAVEASFDLTTLIIDNQDNNNITLTGTGILHLTGFDDTPGTWSWSGNTDGTNLTGTFSWSADATPTPVEIPEPALLALLGLGLVGLAFNRRRRIAN